MGVARGPEDDPCDGEYQRDEEHGAQLDRGEESHGVGPRAHVVHLHHGVKKL